MTRLVISAELRYACFVQCNRKEVVEMRMTLIAAAIALASSYALPAMAESHCDRSKGSTTTSSDTTSPATTITADAGAKQSKPSNPKN